MDFLKLPKHTWASPHPEDACLCERAPTCVSAHAFVATYVPSRSPLVRRHPCSCRKGTCVKRWSSFYVFHWMTVQRKSMEQTKGSKRSHDHADKTTQRPGTGRQGQQPENSQMSKHTICSSYFVFIGRIAQLASESNSWFARFKYVSPFWLISFLAGTGWCWIGFFVFKGKADRNPAVGDATSPELFSDKLKCI